MCTSTHCFRKPGELEAILRLEARIAEKIQAANASVGMESQVLAALASEERIYADLHTFANRLAEGDETLIDDGEGAESGSSAGEEYRLRLLRAHRQGEILEAGTDAMGCRRSLRTTPRARRMWICPRLSSPRVIGEGSVTGAQ